MKHLFVSYEIAKALEAIGFDQPCFGWFTDNYLRIGGVVESKHVQGEDETLAPTCQQVIDWFREKQDINVNLYVVSKRWCFELQDISEKGWTRVDGSQKNFPRDMYSHEASYTDYYAALNAAIDEAIKLIKI